MKLINDTKTMIMPIDMLDGQIGVIRMWGLNTQYVGRIVQRFGDKLISIGIGTGNVWTELSCLGNECLVEVLPKGTILEI